MGCCENLYKYTLFLSNFVFALAGLALLGLGVYVKVDSSPVANIVSQNLYGAPIFAMVVGAIVFLIAFFGCCGAIRESNCMLVTYSIFMLILIIAKVTLATLYFVQKDKLISQVGNLLDMAFKKNRDVFHVFEKMLHCCGPRGIGSYMIEELPDSCCNVDDKCTNFNVFPSCNQKIQDFLQSYGIFIIVLASIELLTVIFALCLDSHVRNKKNKSRRSRY